MELTQEQKNTLYSSLQVEVSEKKRIELKANALSQYQSIAKTFVGRNNIEIESIEPTSFGVEVFLKAWDAQNNRIGFGDGTVEIERIRLVMNGLMGYVLYRDVGGDIQITDQETGDINRFRVDPKMALLKRLDDVVTTIGKEGVNIIDGKRGRTTTVVDYTAANSNQHLSDNKATYTLARDATTATVSNLGTNNVHNVLHNSKVGATYYVRRADLQFNTSAIADTDTITGLTMTMFAYGSGGADADGYDVSFLDNTNNSNLQATIASEDFDDYGSSPIISKDLTNYTNIGSNVTTQDFGTYGVVNKTGTTRIGLRLSGDINNSTPTGNNVLRIGTGTSGDDPYITVTHSAASTFIPKTMFVS